MKYIALTSIIIMLSACVSTDPYTGGQKTSNTAKGAGIGALAGAVIGAASSSKNDRKKGILTGAAAGAAVGGGAGYYMDRQEAKLRSELQGTGVQVRREGDNISLVMPGNITFSTGNADIRSDFFPVLNSVAKVLKEFNKTAIIASGHTDSTGSDTFNQTLSEKRAASVKGYLVSRQVAAGRVQAVGYGERYPVASNSSSAGREENRRVELKLEPIE